MLGAEKSDQTAPIRSTKVEPMDLKQCGMDGHHGRDGFRCDAIDDVD